MSARVCMRGQLAGHVDMFLQAAILQEKRRQKREALKAIEHSQARCFVSAKSNGIITKVSEGFKKCGVVIADGA